MKNRKKKASTKKAAGAGVGRRDFLKLSLAAGVGLAAPMMFVRKATAQTGDRVLKVVQWNHFVPDYDKCFTDVFVKEFGAAHNCRVQVDYFPTADLPTAVAARTSR